MFNSFIHRTSRQIEVTKKTKIIIKKKTNHKKKLIRIFKNPTSLVLIL